MICSVAKPSSSGQITRRSVVSRAAHNQEVTSRREALLLSVNVGVIASIFTFGAVERPKNLGVQDYGKGVKNLNLCPPTPNCISTSELANDESQYAPPLYPHYRGNRPLIPSCRLYNPNGGPRKDSPITQKQAMEELVSVVKELKPDNFTPTIIENTDDYLYVEYQSPTFGFIDDCEFWFPSDKPGTLEYRSASRIGESDGQINRKRIRAIRKELEKVGWRSAGF